MRRLLVPLAVVTIASAALLACAAPRERSERQTRAEPVVERQPTPAAEPQEQSELADLAERPQGDASTASAAESFEISGFGDADAIHELAAGLYQCNIDLQDNLQGDRAALFRVRFLSREPLHPAVISTTQSSWNTTFELLLAGRDLAGSSSVELMVRAASAGEWTLQCERRNEFVRSGRESRGAIQLSANIRGEPRGNVGISSGRGSGIAMMSGIPDVYTCQISFSGNFTDDGEGAQFVVKLGEMVLVDVSTSDWSGEVEYELTDDGGIRPTLAVDAADSASWDVVCSPKSS